MPISSSHLELFSGFKGKIDTLDDSVRFWAPATWLKWIPQAIVSLLAHALYVGVLA